MTDFDNTIILAGRVVSFVFPTQGQIESMVRIARTLERGADDAPVDFWMTQISRIGMLIDALIAPGDQETVDELYLTGKISSLEVLKEIMAKVNASAQAAEGKANPKASKTRVRRD